MKSYEVTHPHQTTIRLDPVEVARLRRAIDWGDGEVVLTDIDRSEPGHWQVTLNCASEAVAERMEEGWG